MAAKRSTVEARAAKGDAKAFTVVLEDLRSRFEVFGEALQGLREHMDTRFEQVDARFEQVDARFEQVDARFEQVDARFALGEHQLGLVKSVLIEHGRELKDIRRAVGRLETKLEEKLDRADVVEDALSKRRQNEG